MNLKLTAAPILNLLLLLVSGTAQAQDAPENVAAAAAASTTRAIVAYKSSVASAVRQAVAVAARGKQYATQQEVDMALVNAKTVDFPSGTMSAMAIELPTASLEELSRNPNVAFVEKDVKHYHSGELRTTSPLTGERDLLADPGLTSPSTGNPFATGQQVPYGIKMVQADLLASTDASNMKVFIIDDGYSLGHEDLPSDSTVVTGESIGIGPIDNGFYSWHGTHVAGTISALNNTGTGVVGVHSNNSLKLHIINVFGDNEFVYGFDLVYASFKCAYAGAYVISMSIGGTEMSKWESLAYAEIYKYDILIVAAAGNGGDSVKNYPAAYSSVVSVAAIDVNQAIAPFSTFNNDVELSGPGVNVLSTIPVGMSPLTSLVVGSTTYASLGLIGSPFLSSSAPLANFGIGDKVDTAAVSGKVCLIGRGTIYLIDKVLNCQNSGGVAAVIYNNVAGEFTSFIGPGTDIPSLTVSDTEGAALLKQLGQIATVAVSPNGIDYAYFSGTSMATPHVSAVAALVWAQNPKCTAAQLRKSLAKSALDLGSKGRDKYYGHGLVQAKAADDRIKKRGCGK